jgi:UDP-2,4-diacetamido-2,4,6-trideoxy-beta-L-altropyranose hydrolase
MRSAGIGGRRRILLRADASAQIGTGHVMRCATLACAIRARGWAAALVGRMPEDLAAAVRDTGVEVHPLPDGLAFEAEPDLLAARGWLDGVDVVVADHYALGDDWRRSVAGGGRVVMAIDDVAASPLAADVVLNQNLGASPERYRGLVATDTVILAGPRFALLRPEFAELRSTATERSGRAGRILVFMSGADEHDVTSRAARVAAATDIVVGSAYPFLQRLLAWTAGIPTVTVHINTPDMPALMAAADLAIGAPSSASWERCALGLPAILVILAENQVENAARLQEAGAAVSLGWHNEVSDGRLAATLYRLCADQPLLRAMSRAAAEITDGRGAARTCDALEAIVAGR